MKKSCHELPIEFIYQEQSIKIDGCCCAIIGVEEGSIIYDYDLLVTHFMDHECMTSEDNDFPDEQAVEWIENNVLRGISYLGFGIKPKVMVGCKPIN